ncbi:MAG: SapC family protein [Alteromonadaceae bacterium]|nr:SapC family protein [Alteromonadaceae bacterium]
MANHQMLDNVTHKDVRIITDQHPDLGDTGSYATTFINEFRDVQNQYPIFFRKNTETAKFEAIALFGFAESENLYLDDQGWHASYIPLSVQRRPFLIGFKDVDNQGVVEQEAVVHIDMDSPRINTERGELVFLPQGGQSEYLQSVSNILGHIHEGHQMTDVFIDTMLELELIESVNIKVTLDDGSEHELNSLYTLHEEKVQALDAEVVAQLHQKGYLQHMYMQMASLANMPALIRRKNQVMGLS